MGSLRDRVQAPSFRRSLRSGFRGGRTPLHTIVYRFDYRTGLSHWPPLASENAGWSQGLLEGRDA
jgi:hypothetical protein